MPPGLTYRSKTDLVADALKEMMHSGELAPGATLRQRDVADQLGVSPTPVREAFRRLEAEGFIVTEAHRAAVVVRSENNRLYENAVIRAALEGLGAKLAAERIDEEDIRELESLNEQLANAPDHQAALALNRKFHFRIYEITESPVLIAQLNLLWRTLGDGPPTDRPLSESVAHHQDIIESLRARDGEKAEAATSRHIIDAFASLAPESPNRR
ncbi:MAG: GntR family transcriptional regulator [Acidimicrobiia bacterium]